MSIVRCAEQQLDKKKYDCVYCVFDRNGHVNYHQALHRISQLTKIEAITSVPCFEIWVLLHFNYSAAPFTAVGADSACARVIKEVRKHLPMYDKGYNLLFDELENNVDQAIKHATSLDAHNSKVGVTNPSTRVHVLVDFLRKLRAT